MILDHLLNEWKLGCHLGTIDAVDFEDWINSMNNMDLIRAIDEALERAKDD
jgi:hypothetical protein